MLAALRDWLMGASGSGKSTLLYAMSGMDWPTSGLVELDGREITSLDDAELSRVRLTQGFLISKAVQRAQQSGGLWQDCYSYAHDYCCLAGLAQSHGRSAASGLRRNSGDDHGQWETGGAVGACAINQVPVLHSQRAVGPDRDAAG